MERKIYKKLNKPRIKYNLEFFKCYWWLRSAFKSYRDVAGTIDIDGDFYHVIVPSNYCIASVCMI